MLTSVEIKNNKVFFFFFLIYLKKKNHKLFILNVKLRTAIFSYFLRIKGHLL